MGWFSNDIYGGDDTQTLHIDFCKWAKIIKRGIEKWDWAEDHLLINKTKLSKEEQKEFLKNINLVTKKLSKTRYFTEDSAIEWHMLGALFVDNKMDIPREIANKAIAATEYLMGEHAEYYNNPSARRRVLFNFLKRFDKLKVI